jgi:hypothetical protein
VTTAEAGYHLTPAEALELKLIFFTLCLHRPTPPALRFSYCP